MSTSCEVSFEPLRFDGSNYDSWSAHVLHVLHTWGSPFEQVVEASILPEDFDSEDTSNLSKEEKENVLLNYSITNLMYNNVSKVIQEFIFNNEDICDDAHHIWVALKDMYISADDDDDEFEKEESLEECSTSTSCIPPLKTSSTKQKSDNIATAASDQANSVAPTSELGGTGFGSDQHQLAS
jgi:hypothetical protein